METHTPESVVSKEEIPTTPTKTGKWSNIKTSISSIHPAWLVSFGLFLIICVTVFHYEIREKDQFYMPGIYMRHSGFSEGRNHRGQFFQNPGMIMRQGMMDPWQNMEKNMEDLRAMQKKIIDQSEQIPANTSVNANYTGTKIINNSSLTYTIESSGGILKGSITTSESGTINTLKSSIEKLGYSTKINGNTLSISGNTIKIHDLLNILK